jgi:hypothetical protein
VKLLILELALGKRMSRACQGALEKCSPNFTLPTAHAELFSLKHAINKEIKMLENNDNLSRAAKKAETCEAHLAAGDLAGAKALRNIIIAGETREMWRQIRSMEDKHDQGMTWVQIPAERDLTNPNCKTCETWITLDQPEAIREVLIQWNKLHFRQAQGTFPLKAPFFKKIT